jgi:hypothetical protein
MRFSDEDDFYYFDVDDNDERNNRIWFRWKMKII